MPLQNAAVARFWDTSATWTPTEPRRYSRFARRACLACFAFCPCSSPPRPRPRPEEDDWHARVQDLALTCTDAQLEAMLEGLQLRNPGYVDKLVPLHASMDKEVQHQLLAV